MHVLLCVEMGKQGGTFCWRLMLEKSGNGMKERELQKFKLAQVRNLLAGRWLPGGHLAASRVTTLLLADPGG